MGILDVIKKAATTTIGGSGIAGLIGGKYGNVQEGIGDYFMGPTRAARAQANAADRGIESQERMFEASMATQKPWLEEGEKALRGLSSQLESGAFDVQPGKFGDFQGGGDFQFGDFEGGDDFQFRDFDFNYEQSPGYQFALQEGLRASDRGNAAAGGLQSGGADLDRMRYAQGLASQDYGQQYDRAYGQYSDDYNRAYGQHADKYAREYGEYSDDYSRAYGQHTDEYNRDYGQYADKYSRFSDDYNRQLTQTGNRYNRMASMAGIGQAAAGNVSGMQMQQGQNMASAYMNQGNAQANKAMVMQNQINPYINMGIQGMGAYLGGK